MIRLKNIDTGKSSGKMRAQTYLAYPISDSKRIVFVAPVDCRLDTIDIYSVTSGGCATFLGYVGSLTTTLLGGDISGIDGTYLRNRITPTSNRELTAGNTVSFSISATAANSAAHIIVTFEPLKHRGTV